MFGLKKKIKIRYVKGLDGKPVVEPLESIKIGNWIDLRSAETVVMKKGEFKLISLGVAMHLPKGYEAHVAPRSSLFKNHKVIQANHFGIIDNSYCGNEDIWRFPAIAMEDTQINANDRICQFRIVKSMPQVKFEAVDDLGNKNRGGFGSTGKS